MNGVLQGWLVARREIRERSRSKVFRAGIVITLALVITAIVAAAKIHPGTVTRDLRRSHDVRPVQAGLSALGAGH